MKWWHDNFVTEGDERELSSCISSSIWVILVIGQETGTCGIGLEIGTSGNWSFVGKSGDIC
ncbi:MAG: hypothetical protein ACEY3B_06725, partial [Wolbachia sp.]